MPAPLKPLSLNPQLSSPSTVQGVPVNEILDQMIEERAPTLSANKAVWGMLRKVLDPLLMYQEAVRLANIVAQQTGKENLRLCSDRLQLKVNLKGADRIPTSGRTIIISNHPTGLADGIAMFDALVRVREDFMIYANSDAFRISERFDDVLIPVELNKEKANHRKSREALIATNRAMKAEKALVIFPSGRLSFMTLRGIRERVWKSSFVRIAQKYQAPIIPMHITARNSWLFYTFAMMNKELRDISLFYELLNKSGREFDVQVGPAIPYEAFADQDPEVLTPQMQAYVEKGALDEGFVLA